LDYQRELQERASALSIPEMFRRRRVHNNNALFVDEDNNNNNNSSSSSHRFLAAAYQRMAVTRIRYIISWIVEYFEPWLREGHWEDLAAFDFPAMIAALRDFLREMMPPTAQTEGFAGYQNRLQHLHDAVREHATQRRFLTLAQSLGATAAGQQQQQQHHWPPSDGSPRRPFFLNDDLLRSIADHHPVVVFGSLVPWAIFTD
jgi:hypothetical protein